MNMKKIVAVLVGFLLVSASLLMGSDESSALNDFQRLLQSFDPNAFLKAVNEDHSGSSDEQKREQFERRVTDSALAVMDKAADFERRFPQSQQLREVRAGAGQSISMAFGYLGFPIPAARAAEVESCTRRLLGFDGQNGGLQMVLFHIAERQPPSQQRVRLEELSRQATSGEACERAKTALRNLARLGLPLELSFAAVGGEAVSPAALKGKVVVVDFWAPSCGPCVRDFPGLKEFYSKHKAEGLEVLGISVDPDEKALRSYLEKHPLPWPVKYDGSESTNRIAEAFGIHEIPVVWLIDRRGKLRDLNGRDDRDKKIEALLLEP
jgi:thiol-disulfide isomerase/thioredoxin